MESCDLLCLDLEAAEAVRSSLDRDRAVALASRVKVFADPTRLLIVEALAMRELCGCDLGWICGQSDKLVSHHLGRLKRDGIVASRREGLPHEPGRGAGRYHAAATPGGAAPSR
jgi:DNA-binding transcriptional ArsR family regulator